jgi:flagellar basal-body rod protein FlgF
MDKLIYVAMNGAKSVMRRQDNLAHNLAHVSTPGFRAEMLSFQPVDTSSDPQGKNNSLQVFSQEASVGSDFTPGPVQRTGRPLDVAIGGSGWLAVQARDGKEAYTRNGALEVDATGVLKTGGGLPVLGDSGPIIVPPDSEVTIARDGTVSAVQNGQGLSNVQVLGRLKLVDPPAAQMQKGEDGLFRTRNGAAAASSDTVGLSTGAIEGSNVNPVEAMVGMISAARQFEMQMKLLQTAEANSRSAAVLLQGAG